MVAQNDGKAAHAIRSDQSNLDARVVRLDGNHRGDAGFGEIDVFDRAPGFFQIEAQRQSDRLEVRAKCLEILRREAREQTVLLRIGGHITLAHGRERSCLPVTRARWLAASGESGRTPVAERKIAICTKPDYVRNRTQLRPLNTLSGIGSGPHDTAIRCP